MASSILRYTKIVCEAFPEVKGKLKYESNSMIGRLKLDDRHLNLLYNYADFVLHSGIVSEATKIYLTSIETSPMDAIRAYNRINEGVYGEISAKKASNHLYYDTKRLLELFPDDMLANIIYKKGDIAFYEDMLRNAISKKTGKSLLGKISIFQIPAAISKEKPTEEELDNFFMLFAPYTKSMVKYVNSQLSRDVIGYLNYIASKSNKTPEEKEILDRLKQLDKREEE